MEQDVRRTPRQIILSKAAQFVLVYLLLFAINTANSMHIEWARMTAQTPVERAPLVADIDRDGTPEILALNRGGQILLWTLDGAAIGKGQGGMATQLPQGRWSSRLIQAKNSNVIRLATCSVEGLVVGLNTDLRLMWQYRLPGETTWGYAWPAVIPEKSGDLFCFADHSGTITCLDDKGQVKWASDLHAGPCIAPLQTFQADNGESTILAPMGSTLFRLTPDGKILWRKDFGEAISTRPQVVLTQHSHLIVCGTKEGTLTGINPHGKELWKANIGDEVNAFISSYPRKDADPLILCTGLWGNLHAFDVDGRLLWVNEYGAKGRGEPLVFDADGDGDKEIVVSTYAQHLYVFDEKGMLVDDVRLNGIINSSPLAFYDPAHQRYDMLLSTHATTIFRLAPGKAVSPYHVTAAARDINLKFLPSRTSAMLPSVLIDNPNGAFINVNIELLGRKGSRVVKGCLTARSRFEMPLHSALQDVQVARVIVTAGGEKLLEKTWDHFKMPSMHKETGTVNAWATPAYGDFDEQRLFPVAGEFKPGEKNRIRLNDLYVNEVDQGAFIVASGNDQPIRLRTTIENPKRQDGLSFGGTITLREVISIGSINGERVPDALPALNPAGVFTLPAHRAEKIWLSVDAHNASPGEYRGAIRLISLENEGDTLRFSLELDIPDLKMPDKFSLSVCTWDYVPNKWFPDNIDAVLDDMTRHGVNVFPRGAVPRAKANKDGSLTFDWSRLDTELDRLQGRGVILFQLSRPPIVFPEHWTKAKKRKVEIAYLRTFRDYLKEKGWDYSDYAFYPLDEPGLHLGKNVPILLKAARLFREADPKMRIYTDPVVGLSWQDFENIVPNLDIWCPNMRLVAGLLSDSPIMERILKSNEPVWSYECIGYVKTLSPLRYNRANAWRADYFGLDGIGFWTHSRTNTDLWFANADKGGEYALVYPGETPVPSARWEAVRDGLEDVSAIKMLQRQIEKSRSRGADDDLVQQAVKALRIAKVDIMELSDLAFIHTRDYRRPGEHRVWHTWTDVETYRRHRAEIARMTLALKNRQK